MHQIIQFIKTTITASWHDDISKEAAAFAFFTIFSLIPILLLLVLGAGLFVGQSGVIAELRVFAENSFGPVAGDFVHTVVNNVPAPQANVWFILIAVVLAIYGAWFVFDHLRKAFFIIFDLSVEAENFIARTVKLQGFAFFYMVILFLVVYFLIFANLISASLISLAQSVSGDTIPSFLYGQVSAAATFLLLTGLFTLIYHLVAMRTLSWVGALSGALTFSVLFTIGSTLFSLYVSASITLSFYGAASVLVVFLLWTYYLGLILFYGGEVANVWDRFRRH